MLVTTTRVIDAPIDRVWALQLDHEGWPQHLPNFQKVVRHLPDRPFGLGSSADITQPALGTVRWTVDEFEATADRRSYAWTGRAKGVGYTGRHAVRQLADGRTELVLSIVMAGGLAKVIGPMVRGTIQKSIDAEAAAFAAWAASATEA